MPPNGNARPAAVLVVRRAKGPGEVIEATFS